GSGLALEDHAIVVGYGLNGRAVARALRSIEVPVVILELDPRRVRLARASGYEVLWADGTQRTVLEQVAMPTAKALVIAIEDPAATRQVVSVGRLLNPAAAIFARTRLVSEMDELVRLGATAAIPQELETALELTRVLMPVFGASSESLDALIAKLRAELGPVISALR
ncbi:MAG: NAD(P)-binding protein, partial [bacterium]